MAFERIGIGAIMTFDEKAATASMGKARVAVERVQNSVVKVVSPLKRLGPIAVRTFSMMRTGASRVTSGFSKMTSGLMSMVFALGVFTLALGAGAKVAADFEQQMSTVKSVTDFTGASFVQLEAKAKELGATTAFTATEAAGGMELLGRAGFTAGEQLVATGNVLNLAAADSIELSQAADVTAQVLRGMGLAATESGRVVDVLAATSANANTNVIALGESFKMAASTAVQMDIPIEETAAILGTMSDAGLRGTMAGTAFSNMMLKLSKPSKRAGKLMKDLGVHVKGFRDETTGVMKVDFPGTIETIAQGLMKIENPLERAGAAAEIFGIRGQKAANAFVVKGAEGLSQLTEKLEEAAGTAKAMAEMRLDNFNGQITLLTSAIQGFAIELFTGALGPITDLLKNEIIPAVSNLAQAFQKVNAATSIEDFTNAQEQHGKTTVAIIVGIKNAITTLTETFDSVVAKVREWGQSIEDRFGPDAISKVTKWVTIFAFVAAALAPVILALMTAGFVLGGLASMAAGVGAIISGAFFPVLIILGVLGAAFLALRTENETFLETSARVWTTIKAFAIDVWENALKPFWEGVQLGYQLYWPTLANTITTLLSVIGQAIDHMFGAFSEGTTGTGTDWVRVGEVIMGVVAGIITFMAKLITVVVLLATTAVRAAKAIFNAVVDFILFPFVSVWDLISNVVESLGMIFSGDIIAGFKRLGQSILNFFLAPLRMVVRQIIRLSDVLDDDLVPQGLRDFANQGTLELTSVADAPKHTSGKRVQAEFLPPSGAVTDQLSKNKSEEADLLASITGKMGAVNAADQKAAMAKLGEDMKSAVDKQPCIENTTSVNLDGAEVARSTARHESEIKDRAGFKATPYQRRMAVEQGAAPIRK
jgi:TP901 family phage tail tape measure protein